MRELRFQVLGPVRAWRGGLEVDIGARKQRAVLAGLLLNLDQPMSAENLVAFVWGEAAPPAASSAIHTYVRGLRRALDPDRPARSRDGLVTSTSHGYRLCVDADQVDHRRFLRLIAEARRHWAAGRVDPVLDTLTVALNLWSGRPLVDLGGHLPQHPQVVSLEHERLAAGSLVADAALASGRIEESIPFLVQLTAGAPLHEPLQARLIEVYRRAGRRAEALATFDRVRRKLRDDLGVGPGGELSSVFHRILAEDRATGRQLTAMAR